MSVLLLAFVLKSKLNLDAAFTPIVSIEIISILLVVFGIMNVLKISAVVLIIATFAFGVFCIVKNWKSFLKFISSPAVIAFILGSVVLWTAYEIHDVFYWFYDEFTHWGPFFKGLFTNDCLHIYANHDMFHPTYPQAGQVFYYYLSQLSKTFQEPQTFVANGIIITAGVTAMLYGETWKKPLKSILGILCVPLFLALFPYCDAYITVYYDALLGTVFGATLIAAVTADITSKKDVAVVSIGCMMLTQIKANGFLFALVCIAILFFVSFFSRSDEKPRPLVKCLLSVGGVAATSAFMSGLWKIALLLTGNNIDQFSANYYDGFIPEIFAAIAGQNERVALCWKAFTTNFVHMPIVYNGYGTVLALFVLFSLFAVVFGIWLWRKKKLRGISLALMSMPLFFLCYLFTIFYTYVCYMNYGEAILNASYQRYVSSFIIGWVMLIVAVFLTFGDEFLLIKGKSILPSLLLAAMVLVITKTCVSRDVLNMKQIPEEAARPAYAQLCSQISDSIDEDGKVICLFDGDVLTFYIFRYLCFDENLPNTLPLQLYNMSSEEMRTFLKDNDVKYAIMYIANDEFVENNRGLFSDDLSYFLDTECPCVYDIDYDGEYLFKLLKKTSLT